MKLNTRIANADFKHKELLTIDFNESCNNHCLNCPRQYRFNEEWNEYWTFDQAKKIIDYILTRSKINTIHVGILAEFCLYPFNAEILEYINKTYPNVNVIITTNLTVLSNKLYNAILKCNEYITINVSLWASNKEEYQELHGSNNFDNVINNLERLMQAQHNSNFKLMCSTVEYTSAQLSSVIELMQELCNKHGLVYNERRDERIAVKDKFTLYINLFRGKPAGPDKDEEYNNTAIGYNCNLVTTGINLTYNKIFPCISAGYRCKFSADNLDDLGLKLTKILENENTMPECKNCVVGRYCCGK